MKRILLIFVFLIFASVSNAQFNVPPVYLSRDYKVPTPAKFRSDITALYRKTNKEEMEAIKPRTEDSQKYAAFLQHPDTGLIRLASNKGCAENSKVIVANDDCLKFTMPGAGSSYSFRVKDYRVSQLADLTFVNKGFLVTGNLIHGFLTVVGDIPLENITLQTLGLKYLTEFTPVTDYAEAQKFADVLVKGVVKDRYIYRRGLGALENNTYVLRSVAYDGVINRTVNGFTYNELEFDKRRDVIVAFRIVSKDADGVTILWKKLSEKDAPELKLKKEPKSKKQPEKFTASKD